MNKKNYKYNQYLGKKLKMPISNYKEIENNSINIPEIYIELLSREWPSTSVLSNSILLSSPLENFNYTDKIDGLHTFLLIFDYKVYKVSKTPNLLFENIEIKNMNFEGDCILETEFYNNIYFIFDVYYLNGINYSNKFLFERIDKIKQYINELGPNFKIKNFYNIPSLNFLLEYIKNDKSPEGNEIDGVILQRIDKPYFQENRNKFNNYKLKPLHLNTIDFLLKYNYRYNNFNLYLKGNINRDYDNNFKKLPKDRVPLRYKGKTLIYFDSPFYPNLGIMEINKNWNKNNYSEKSIKLIDNLLDQISKNPMNYNNKIIELSLTDDKKWVPLRIREDKILPNSYRVGLNNISIIFDPIKPLETIYFQKNLSISDEDNNVIHTINQTFRKFIIEQYINDFGRHSSIIDLCGGRGADEFNLYSNGVSNFFVIDNDTTALKRYFDRTYGIENQEYIPLTHKYKNNLYGNNYITLNFLNYKLDKDYQQIKNDLLSRYEFKNKVDIVLMNFAIHYLCDEKEKLEKLCEFVESVLFKDGIFIITYYDGDEIMKNKKDNFSKIGPFNIEIIKEEKEKNITIAKMPLPTFKSGDDIYKEEPLVHKNMIKILENYFDLYEEYYIYDKCKRYIDKIYNAQNFIEYYKLIKVAIYSKKINFYYK